MNSVRVATVDVKLKVRVSRPRKEAQEARENETTPGTLSPKGSYRPKHKDVARRVTIASTPNSHICCLSPVLSPSWH